MQEKIKILLSKIIYEKLELNIIENEILNANIKSKEVIKDNDIDLVSRYFFLMNDIYLERLNESEQQVLEKYINNIDFTNIKIPVELYNLLLEKMFVLLLPNTNEKYLSWYGTGDNFIAPSDSIVLGFHYIKYLGNDENNISVQEEIIYEKMNYIQSVLAPSKNMKVSVLIFDELVNEKSKAF